MLLSSPSREFHASKHFKSRRLISYLLSSVYIVVLLSVRCLTDDSYPKEKRIIIGIGWKKSGTTSLGEFLLGLGLGPACQCSSLNELRRGRSSISVDGEFATNYKLVASAKKAFPNASFVLTYRRPDSWNASVVRWIRKKPQNRNYYSWLMMQSRCRIPNCYLWPECKDNHQKQHFVPNCYHRPPPMAPVPGTSNFVAMYLAHTRRLRALFENTPSHFLELNLEDDEATFNAAKLCHFLNVTHPNCRSAFPHRNVNDGVK